MTINCLFCTSRYATFEALSLIQNTRKNKNNEKTVSSDRFYIEGTGRCGACCSLVTLYFEADTNSYS